MQVNRLQRSGCVDRSNGIRPQVIERISRRRLTHSEISASNCYEAMPINEAMFVGHSGGGRRTAQQQKPVLAAQRDLANM